MYVYLIPVLREALPGSLEPSSPGLRTFPHLASYWAARTPPNKSVKGAVSLRCILWLRKNKIRT